MKKLISVLLTLSLVLGLVACATDTSGNGTPNNSGDTNNTQEQDENISGGDGDIQVALLIAAESELDDRAFNTDAWNAITDFCKAEGLNYSYFKPSDMTVEMCLASCDAAVRAGAEFIVVCSSQFQVALLEMSEQYPDVQFLSFEAIPQTTDGEVSIHDNVKVVNFSAEQSGYMAGYACVMDGYRDLGVLCATALPGIIQYAYGFIAGADAAAAELEADDVNVKYMYLPGVTNPERQTTAASWYQTGTEIIFTVAGPGNFSVFAAAEQNDGLCVGCDSDQAAESDTVVLSALKDLYTVCYNTLEDWTNGAFTGGESYLLGVNDHATGLAIKSSKLENFTEEDYDALYQQLIDNEDGLTDAIPNDRTHASPTDIPLETIRLDYIA